MDEALENASPSCKSLSYRELMLKAETELNEIPTERFSRVQEFREAVSLVPGLESRTDESFLLRFLRARKFDQVRALELLKNYYKQRTKYPDLYRNLLASSIPHVLAEPILGVLPNKDPKGRAIFVFNTTGKWNPSTVPMDDVVRYVLLSMECAIAEEETQISGAICLMDCQGFGIKHLLAHSPFMLAKMISVTINSFPARFKELHAINEPIFFKWMFNLLRPLLSQKLKDRFFFHGDDRVSLHDRISPEILPEEFGGLLGPFSNVGWNKMLLKNDTSLKENIAYGYQSTTE